jgi:CIC family chloride channel protein
MLFAQLFALWLPGAETAILLGLAGMATLLAATTRAHYVGADGL